MTTAQHEAAAQHLVAARNARRPGSRLPDSCRPTSFEDALAVQKRVGEILGLDIGGWKVSLPSPGKLIVGPIYSPFVSGDTPYTLVAEGAAARVEPEIAFVMGRDLPPRGSAYSEVEIREAVREARAVLETLGCRYAQKAECAFPEMLADGLQNYGLFVGPVLPGPVDGQPEKFPVAVHGPGGVVVSKGGRHPDSSPIAPLYFLANFLSGRGEGLRAGQIVTTGSYCGVLDVPFATPLRFEYAGIAFPVEFRAAE